MRLRPVDDVAFCARPREPRGEGGCMNRKRLRRLEAAVAKRGGKFAMNPDSPPEVTVAFLTQLLECPDCRPAVLEAFEGEDAGDGRIEERIRAAIRRGGH